MTKVTGTANGRPDLSPEGSTKGHTITAQVVHDLLSTFDTEVPSVDALRAYYADDLHFQDPLQIIKGIVPFREMNVRLLQKVSEMSIEMLDSAQTGPNIMFTFAMDLRPSARAPLMRVEGMTHVRLNGEGKIELHRDYWDLAGTIVNMIPPLKRPYGWLTKKMA